MRILSGILIITLLCTFIHESLHHEDGPGTGAALLSHAGPQHHHGEHEHERHHHPDDSGHDSDHHDEDSHDHQFRLLITKKNPSSRLQALANPAGMIDHIFSGDSSFDRSNRYYYITQRCNPPSPEYLRAHVLRL